MQDPANGSKVADVREVLVVDDDADIRAALHTFLESEGYAVSEAADGRPVLARLEASPAGLIVLLDLTMPSMDGVAVLEAAARRDDLLRRHAFILVTARAGRTMPLALATRLQAFGVPILPKPFELDHCHLQAIVEDADARLG